ncbi:hypothetical protein Hypma_011129 [Hypsizygus marmoreus]|uniref:Uncharacterized protein n=1 Tax=Hypsizygus marmoreus TaxID=39966 RepID=A0A369JHQ5_HYPMA|nr:hypothetical protein Hypma_011129 [Hypsizygus marmoreus]
MSLQICLKARQQLLASTQNHFAVMITTLLLAQPDKHIRWQDVGQTVLNCLHGIHAIEKALSTFRTIISKSYLHAHPTSDILSVFDAHVGDCACHLCLQMLRDLIDHFSSPEKKEFIERGIALLNVLKGTTAGLLQQLAKKNGNTQASGFTSIITTSDLLRYIGFTKFIALVQSESNVSGSSTLAIPSTPESHPFQFSENCEVPLATCRMTVGNQNGSHSDSSSDSNSSYSSSHSHRSLTVSTEWNLNDTMTIIQFLMFTRLLSVSKKAILEPGPPSQIIARVDPQFSYAQSEQELEALKLVGVPLSTILHSGDKAKNNSLVNNLYFENIAISAHQISCISAYTSILPIHAAWLTMKIPILLVIQRFCSHGYHVIFQHITPKFSACDLMDSDFASMGQADWFNINMVALEEAISAPWAMTPHFIFICVSMDRRLEDFYGCLADKNQEKFGCNKPHDKPCREMDDYAHTIQDINFSHVIMRFFMQHEQFPFPLQVRQDGYKHVASLLESNLGEEVRNVFLKAWSEAEEFGTGRSARLYSFQHVYSELPSVVASQVKGMLERKEKPALIGYHQA